MYNLREAVVECGALGKGILVGIKDERVPEVQILVAGIHANRYLCGVIHDAASRVTSVDALIVLDVARSTEGVYGFKKSCTSQAGICTRVPISERCRSIRGCQIFDEATSALDYETENTLQQNMPDLCEGRTVIIISHRLSSVKHADRILTMDRGTIVETGKHAELIANRGLYARLVALQSS